jgi:hypothetical protein
MEVFEDAIIQRHAQRLFSPDWPGIRYPWDGAVVVAQFTTRITDSGSIHEGL